jgi:hypothetical protein
MSRKRALPITRPAAPILDAAQQRHADILAQKRRDLANPDSLTMGDLLDWEHRNVAPGFTAGSDMPSPRGWVVYEDGDDPGGQAEGTQSSVWTA